MSVRAMKWAYDLYARVKIEPPERAVLNALCFCHHDKTGDCFPSYDTLSNMTGYRRRRVIEAVNELRRIGVIEVRQRRVNGHQGSNHFVLFRDSEVIEEPPTRVHKKAPCKSADGSTLPRVPPWDHDRGIYTLRAAKPVTEGSISQWINSVQVGAFGDRRLA